MVVPDCFQLNDVVRRHKALDMAGLAREVSRAAQAWFGHGRFARGCRIRYFTDLHDRDSRFA